MFEPGVIQDLPDADAAVSPAVGPMGRLLRTVSRAFAIAGGLMFIALVAMSLVSIIGRKLAAAPVPGDMELLQMGTAVASAAMLAYCEMERHHLRVDFFTARLSAASRDRLDALSHLVLAGVAWLVAWRTGAAAVSLKEAGEASMVLGWPVWVAVALLVPSFVLLGLAGLYNAALHVRAAISGAKS